MNYIRLSLLVSYAFSFLSYGIASSIEDKLSMFEEGSEGESTPFHGQIRQTNQQLAALKQHLSEVYTQIDDMNESDLHDAEYELLLDQVNQIKNEISSAEKDYRKLVVEEAKQEGESYGIWDQEEMPLSQLVMEYGSSEYLYVIPPEINNIKVHVHSHLPIPRESWAKLIDLLLAQNGVGVKEINPFTKQLFLHKQDLVGIQHVFTAPQQLRLASDTERVAYIFSPSLDNLKAAFYFFDRFKDPKKTFIYTVGNKIAIVSLKDEVQKLLTLYDSIWERDGDKMTKVVALSRIPTDEAIKILKTYFGSLADGNRYAMSKGGNELSVHPLKQENSIILIGTKEAVSKAESIVKETESQMEDPSEMTVYWYTCSHSDPNDLAEVLEKVYNSLIYYSVDDGTPRAATNIIYNDNKAEIHEENTGSPVFEDPRLINPVTPPLVQAGTIDKQTRTSSTTHFIPYPKTGSLMMVVRKDTLPKIKELLKKLDVPKKMVQIEVLLCEKKLNQQTNSGLNVLKLGSAASGQHNTSIIYDASPKSPVKGLFEFFISRKKPNSWIPAYDLSYHFLLAQEDMRINASPSILTVNQTPATISIVEEISINNGAAPIDTNSNITFEKSYTREQFGITIVMTPTIHDVIEQDEGKASITLDTNITFDTPKNDIDDRPKVNRRHIQNQVRVLDGQTIIIGGLRKKQAEDKTEKIPFLGEIPGIAKLFGTSKMTDQMTEMYIFITPKVVTDPKFDLERILKEELLKRPGDMPEIVERIMEARQRKRQRLFEQSFKLIFGNLDGPSANY